MAIPSHAGDYDNNGRNGSFDPPGGKGTMSRAALSLALVLASVIAIHGLSGGDAAAATAAENRAGDTMVPLGSNMAIEKSVVALNVPEDNSLPWAFVEGTVSNPVPDYPVIIQIYDNNNNNGDAAGDGPVVGGVHFAQTDVALDGSYEYRFRVLDVSDGSPTSVFGGDYTVKIFKVVYLTGGLGAI